MLFSISKLLWLQYITRKKILKFNNNREYSKCFPKIIGLNKIELFETRICNIKKCTIDLIVYLVKLNFNEIPEFFSTNQHVKTFEKLRYFHV